MSLKKFFKSHAETALTKAPSQQFNVSGSSIVESYDAVKQKADFDRKIFAFVDISASLANYVRFGLAEYHYETGIKRIYNDYPFDGSQAEKYKFLNESNTFDYWLWKDKYPKTTGYVTLNEGSEKTQRIEIKSGPNVNNVYNTGTLQANNLAFDSEQGVTIEFWAKPDPQDGDSALFQLNDSVEGTLSIQPSYTSNDIVWLVNTEQESSPEGDIEFASLADHAQNWHHYAFVLTSLGAGSDLTASLYVDGVFTQQIIDTNEDNKITTPINTVSGTLGRYDEIGTLAAFDYYTGSIDEFRYWKSARTTKEIGLNWNTHVDGGSNLTGTTAHPLAAYFKFNEGVTNNLSLDAKVLDYSGRVASASFINYTAAARSTNSAIEEYNSEYYEVPDPIVYSYNPHVVNLEGRSRRDALAYDNTNQHNFYQLMPAWIKDDDTNDLKYLSHIIGSYFDELYAQVSSFEKIKEKNYQGQDLKIFPFYDKLVESHGFNIGNFLEGSDLLAELNEKTSVGSLASGSLSSLKSKVYRNIYNNLLYLYKTKGTEQSVRNLLHCYGVDQNILRMRNYANFTTTTIENRDEIDQYKDKTIDFYGLKNWLTGAQMPNESNIFNYTASSDNNQSYIESLGSAFTIESNAYFPRQPSSDSNFFFAYDTSGSIFGVHAASTTAGDTTFSGSDACGMTAYTVHAGRTERDGKFVLSSSNGIFDAVETGVYDLFDATNWNLAIVFEAKQDQRNLPLTAHQNTYWARLIGYQVESGQTVNSFSISSSVGFVSGSEIINENKRVFVGSERLNFTGSLLYRSQCRIGNCKYYADSLSEEEVFLHAKYKGSEGRIRPYENANRKNNNDTIFVPQYLTTLFHWDFEQVTTPDVHGQFEAKDITSASVNFVDTFGGYGDAVSKIYTGFGFNFPTTLKVYENEFVSKVRLTTPEESTAANVVNSQGESTIIFKPNQAPAREAVLIGKSMYENISRDMLKSFAGLTNFNYLIGNPVNKYRFNYKEMEGLRRLYFDSVENTPKLEKFTKYFKWLDGIVESVIENMLPASTNLASASPNIVESHALERNKYALKYPTLENKYPKLSGTINNIVQIKNVQLKTASLQDARLGSVAAFNYKSASYPVPNFVNAVELGATFIPSGNIDPVVIANTAFKTASTDPRPGSVTPRNFASASAGNYQQTYNVLQTVGQHGAIHGLYLASEKVPADTDSPYVSGVVPYGLPERDKYQTVFRSIFNSPGSPETMGGGLDTATRELSVYNNLNYRNTMVRDALNTLYRTPSAFGGYQSGSAASSSAETASFLNIYRNGYTRPIAVATASYSDMSIRFSIAGTDDLLSITAGPRITNSPKFSISAWVYLEEPATGSYNNIFSYGTATSWMQFFAYALAGGWVLGLDKKFTDRNVQFQSRLDQKQSINQWHHVAVSWDATNNLNYPTMSIDGNAMEVISAAMPTGAFVEAPGSLAHIGFETVTNTGFKGYIDEVSFWDKALNAGQLKEFYYPRDAIIGPSNLRQHSAAQPNSVSPNGNMVSWWKMSSPSGGADVNHTIPDQTNYNAATMENFAAPYGTSSYPPSNSAGTMNTYTTFGSKIIYDNGFVQTQIPATDLQYLWIAESYQSADLNRYQNSTNQLVPNEQITFVSSSDMVSYLEKANGLRYFGTSKQHFNARGDAAADAGISEPIPTDFVRLNTNIYEPLTASTNTLGFPSFSLTLGAADYFRSPGTYFNLSDDAAAESGVQIDWIERYANAPNFPGPAAMLNSLLLHRNGPYGFPSWKAIRKHDNPIVIAHREKNVISFITQSKSLNFHGHQLLTPSLNNVTQSCVSMTDPMFIQLKNTSFDFKVSYANKRVGFTNEGLQVRQGGFEQALSNQPTFLDKIISEKDLTIEKLTVRSNIYPKSDFQFLNETRTRDQFNNTWWKTKRGDRNGPITNSFGDKAQPFSLGPLNNQPFATRSLWSMDARMEFSDALPVQPGWISTLNFGPGAPKGAGDLQNAYTTFHFFAAVSVGSQEASSPTYARRTIQFLTQASYPAGGATPLLNNSINWSVTGGILNTGDALYEVATQSGREPFYNSYAEYAEELRLQGKDYSIVPEFRMDDHIETYLSNGFDFKVQLASFLSLTGTSNTNTAKRYSAAELSNVLGTIQEDTKLGVKKFGLKAKAYLKLLPYDGFYPQQRTVQLATELKTSYVDSNAVDVVWVNPVATGSTTQIQHAPVMRLFYNAYITPGILFNTIKSGLAVDYPIYRLGRDDGTSAPAGSALAVSGNGAWWSYGDYLNKNVLSMSGALYAANGNTTAYTTSLYTLSQRTQYSSSVPWLNKFIGVAYGFDGQGHEQISRDGGYNARIDRVPFEAILSPRRYYNDKYEQFDPNNLARQTGSYVINSGEPKINYELMANNFFAETAQFFLHRGLTSFEGKAQDLFSFDTNKQYGMDLVMTNADAANVTDFSSKILTLAPDLTGAFPIEKGFISSSVILTASAQCVMYDRADAFGFPSIELLYSGSTNAARLQQLRYSAFTPPYYNGFARARYLFQPTMEQHTLDEIMATMTIEYVRATDNPYSILLQDPNYTRENTYEVYSNEDQLHLSSSFIMDAVVETKKTVFNADGDVVGFEEFDSPRKKLVIHSKYECPVLNFKNVDRTIPTYGRTVYTGSVAGLGTTTAPKGMWHQYGEIPNYSDVGIFTQVTDIPQIEKSSIRLTSSLARVLGVESDKKAIGRLATSRQIEEALVVVPYYMVQGGANGPQQQFFELNSIGVDKVIRKSNRPSVLTDSDQLVRQVRLMKKYVFPPFMDFVTFPQEKNVRSPLMYIFEFGRALSQADLSKIWQGVLPDAGRSAEYQEAVIDLDTTYESIEGVGPDSADIIGQNVKTLLASGDIAGILSPDVKSLNDINFNELDFFVFKVKKRAAYEYSEITKNATDDKYQFDFKATGFASTQPFFTEFGKKRLAYSYNYPYDFFSLIELAKIDAQIEMGEDEE
tara:strand:- start:10615 stop:19482 length:8868 start_codon:yes stop_codon:yes gene_type:complete